MKKGYSVTDVKRDRRIGVVAENLKELKQKSCNKLKLRVSFTECRLLVAEDGALVEDDEQLATLPPKTLFVLLKEGETVVTGRDDTDAVRELPLEGTNGSTAHSGETTRTSPGVNREVSSQARAFTYALDELRKEMEYDGIFDLVIQKYKKFYFDAGEQTREFLNTKMKEKTVQFQNFIAAEDDALCINKTMLSDRDQDPEWFTELLPSERTKEQAMSKRAMERIRNYYNKTMTQLWAAEISKSDRGQELIDQFEEDLYKLLISNRYNETYFNRKAAEGARLCNQNGVFVCEGLWNKTRCLYKGHVINPYRSLDDRLMFGEMWHLDHKIERSRSIIPKIVETVEKLCSGNIKCVICKNSCPEGSLGARVDPQRYYLQIFTKNNLKLVYSRCHNKKKHNGMESDVYALCNACYVSPELVDSGVNDSGVVHRRLRRRRHRGVPTASRPARGRRRTLSSRSGAAVSNEETI